MKRLLWILVFAVVPGPAVAQEGPPEPQDSAQLGRLRAEIEWRFAERVRLELGLTGEQVTKLKATQERVGARRRDLMRQQFQHRQALQRQIRPGIAANQDSVRLHMDGLQVGRAELFKIEQEEDRELAGYLTPVQRAQFLVMRQRLIERINEMRRERQEMRRPGGRRPQGGGPRRRP